MSLQAVIDGAWEQRADLSPRNAPAAVCEAVAHVIDRVRSDSDVDLILRLRASEIKASVAGVLVERVIAQRDTMLGFLATSPPATPRTM